MKAEEGILVGAFSCLLAATLIFGLTPVIDGVFPEDYEKALELCEPNGGVEFVYRNTYLSTAAAADCKNGIKVGWGGYDIPTHR